MRIGHRKRSEIGGASGKSHPACVQPARDGAQFATTWKNRCADKPLRLSKVQRILSCLNPFVFFRVMPATSSCFAATANANAARHDAGRANSLCQAESNASENNE
jgi:hypothetical protein